MREVRSISFTEAEDDLLKHFDKQPDRSAYVKQLIRIDINKSKVPIEEKIEQILQVLKYQRLSVVDNSIINTHHKNLSELKSTIDSIFQL